MDTHRKGFCVSLEEGGAGKSFKSCVCSLFPSFIRGRAMGYEFCLGSWSTGLQWYSHKVFACSARVYDVLSDYTPLALQIVTCYCWQWQSCIFKLERKNKEAFLMPNHHSIKANKSVKVNYLILNLCCGWSEESGQFHALAILPLGKELLNGTG
jgi:hypothetical protein